VKTYGGAEVCALREERRGRSSPLVFSSDSFAAHPVRSTAPFLLHTCLDS
jgi:hypothetical protein